MPLVTLGSLVAKARRRADMTNSTFLPDTEWKELILSGVQALRQRLHRGGQEWERSTAEIATVAGQALYELPDDFLTLIQLLANRSAVQAAPVAGRWQAATSDATGWVPLWPFEMNELAGLLNRTDGNADTVRYRLRNERTDVSGVLTPVRKVELRPTPRYAFTLRLEYLPTTIASTADNAVVEGLDGFEDIPVLQAAIYALQKEESDATALVAWLQREEARLDEMATAQDRNRPERVVDVYAQQHETLLDGVPHRHHLRPGGYWP